MRHSIVRSSRALVAALALVLMTGLGSSLRAADTATIDIVLTIQVVDVTKVSPASLSLSTSPGSSLVSDRAVFQNSGSVTQSYQVSVVAGANWTVVTTNAALNADEVRLRAIWHQWDAAVAAGDFDDNDILTTSGQTSSATKFVDDDDTDITTNTLGYDVPTTDPEYERSIFVLFEAPPVGSTTYTDTVTLTVTAVLP